jgi:chromate transporter
MTALLPVLAQVALLSLATVGGALAIVPDLHGALVGEAGLLTEAQFDASIALAQASPGPNVLFVAVLGYQVAGVAGAGLMLASFLLPATVVAYGALRWAQAHHDSRAGRAFKAGMAPVVLALTLASGCALAAHGEDWRQWLAAALAALLAWRSRLPLVAIVGGGALAGALGWI